MVAGLYTSSSSSYINVYRCIEIICINFLKPPCQVEEILAHDFPMWHLSNAWLVVARTSLYGPIFSAAWSTWFFFPTLSRSIQQEKGVDLSANFMTTNFCFFYLLGARYIVHTKGQLISEWIFCVFKSSKKPTKFYQDFCPMKLGQKTW